MARIALVYGTLAGVVVIACIIVLLAATNGLGHAGSEWLGYLVMIVALTMIFFGVKRYRDRERGGVIKFLPAFFLGLSIAIVAGIAYVASWEAYLAISGRDFIAEYTAAVIEAERAKGVTGPALDAQVAAMQALKVQYANPLFRLPMTFLEIFPVGLIVALISAVLLRNPKVLPARA
jgi:hypothetical protein